MKNINIYPVAALAAATLTAAFAAPTVHAQNLFVTSGTRTIGNAEYQDGTAGAVRVGMDSAFARTDSNGDAYFATLNVVNGGNVGRSFVYNSSIVNVNGGIIGNSEVYNTSTTNINDGSVTNAIGTDKSTVNISGGTVNRALGFVNSRVNITGGTVASSEGYNDSIATISGGTVTDAAGTDNSITNIRGGTVTGVVGLLGSTMNISGGSVNRATSRDTTTTNISGGSVNRVIGRDSSITNISGGTLTNGLFLQNTTAKADFVGTGLRFEYISYGGTPYGGGFLADFFQITGTFGTESKTYDLYIQTINPPNNAARGFTFNGATPVNPVVVPEAGTLALILPAIGILGAVVVRRKARFNKA